MDAQGAEALFNVPNIPCINTETFDMIIPDLNNDLTRKATPDGVVSTLTGTAGVTGTNNGTGILASHNAPNCATIDSVRRVFLLLLEIQNRR